MPCCKSPNAPRIQYIARRFPAAHNLGIIAMYHMWGGDLFLHGWIVMRGVVCRNRGRLRVGSGSAWTTSGADCIMHGWSAGYTAGCHPWVAARDCLPPVDLFVPAGDLFCPQGTNRACRLCVHGCSPCFYASIYTLAVPPESVKSTSPFSTMFTSLDTAPLVHVHVEGT